MKINSKNQNKQITNFCLTFQIMLKFVDTIYLDVVA